LQFPIFNLLLLCRSFVAVPQARAFHPETQATKTATKFPTKAQVRSTLHAPRSTYAAAVSKAAVASAAA
jgi:hypothetical protein